MDEARKHVDKVLKESPKNLDAHFVKGNIHLARGKGPRPCLSSAQS